LNWKRFDLINDNSYRELDQYSERFTILESSKAPSKKNERKEYVHKNTNHLTPTFCHYDITFRVFLLIWIVLSIEFIFLIVRVFLLIKVTCRSKRYLERISKRRFKNNSTYISDKNGIKYYYPIDAGQLIIIITNLGYGLVNLTILNV
jgi:beta-lactamase regulating signal transducer with metallopeptidase domain